MHRHIVVVTYFPQTANGKLDRNALPDPVVQEEKTEEVQEVVVGEEIPDEVMPGQFTMADHICNVVEKLRGYRPRQNASLAAIGIDSLGSVLFIRSLSDSLGGLKIDVKTVFAPTVTIRSLAGVLYESMVLHKPGVLQELQIVGSCTIAIGSDLEKGKLLRDDSSLHRYHVEETFEEVLLANLNMFDGIRGILTLLVLWDHFHGVNLSHISATWAVDTQMFVLLSGFTTSLQLRPTREVRSIADTKKPWDWVSFVFTRFVGVFPMLWLALLINAPRWYTHDLQLVHQLIRDRKNSNYFKVGHKIHYDPYHETNFCTSMYVIGMQTWEKEICSKYGPYDVYYGSVIWNCFLIYAAVRLILDLCQKYVRLRRFNALNILSQSASSLSSAKVDIIEPSGTWGSWMIGIFENKSDKKTFIIKTIIYILFITFLFQILKVSSKIKSYFKSCQFLIFSPFFFNCFYYLFNLIKKPYFISTMGL